MTFDIRLVGYRPNGDKIGVLPTPHDISVGMPFLDTPSLEFSYSRKSTKGSIFNDYLEKGLEVSVEINVNDQWIEPYGGRFIVIKRVSDLLDESDTVKITAPSYGWMLSKMRMLNLTNLNTDGKRNFPTSTAGAILRTLIVESRGRGAVTGLDIDFNSNVDSAGVPWTKIVTISYEPGMDVLTILRNLSEQNMIDWRMNGRTLQVFNPSTIMSVDRTDWEQITLPSILNRSNILAKDARNIYSAERQIVVAEEALAKAKADAETVAEDELARSVTAFFQDAIPVTYEVGDVWFDIGNNYQPHERVTSAWVVISNTRIVNAAAVATSKHRDVNNAKSLLTKMQTILTSSKTQTTNLVKTEYGSSTTVYYQEYPPTNPPVGSVWFNPDALYRAVRFSGNNPVNLRLGRDITETENSETIEDVVSSVLVRGDENIFITKSNPSAPTPWGGWEGYVSQGGVTDKGTMAVLLENELETGSRAKAQLTRTLTFELAKFLPFVDYFPGDYINTIGTDGKSQKLRVRQITLERNNEGVTTGNIVLNDRYLEAELRRARRIMGIVGGSTVGGGSGSTPSPETSNRTPKAPTGVLSDSEAYIDGRGFPQGAVTVYWDAVLVDINDISIVIDRYEIWGRKDIANSKWALYATTVSPTTNATITNLPVGEQWLFRIRAIAKNGSIPSAYSAQTSIVVAHDVSAPGKPSTPILSTHLGTISITWDGKSALGTDPPIDFSHLEIAMGATPTPTTIIARIRGAGTEVVTGQPYNELRYFRFRAVDTSGNISEWSEVASTTTQPLVNTDIIGEIISGANIVDGTVVASEKIVGESITGAQIAALAIDAGKIAANAVTADKVAAGAITAEKISVGSISPTALTFGIDELAPNPMWMNEAMRVLYPAGPTMEYITGPLEVMQREQTHVLAITPGAERTMTIGPLTPCSPGELLYLRMEAQHTSGIDWVPSLALNVTNVAGIPIATDEVYGGILTVAGIYIPYEGTTTVPNGGANYELTIKAPVGTVGTWYISSVSLRKAMKSTGPDGQRLEVSPGAIRLWGPNDTGQATIEISTLGATSLAVLGTDDEIVTSINSEGDVSSLTMSTGALSIGGKSFLEYINELPQGTLSKTKLASTVSPITTTGKALISSNITMPGTGDRQIRLTVGIKNVANSTYSMAYDIKFSATSTAALTNSTHTTIDGIVSDVTRWHTYVYEFNSAELGVNPTGTRFLSALITARTSSAGSTSSSVQVVGGTGDGTYLLVEDMGSAVPTGRQSIGGAGESVGLNTVTKSATRKWDQSYKGDGTQYTYDASKNYQGYYLSSNGVLKAAIGAPDQMFTDLAGATVEWIKVYLYAIHWHASSGGTARIGVHGSSGKPTTFPGIDGDLQVTFSRAQGKLITLPTSWWASFKSGAYRGITLHAGNSTSSTYYGYFEAAKTKWEWKYTK